MKQGHLTCLFSSSGLGYVLSNRRLMDSQLADSVTPYGAFRIQERRGAERNGEVLKSAREFLSLTLDSFSWS